MSDALLDAALAYAQRGWRVIPLHNPVFTLAGEAIGCSCAQDGCQRRQWGKHPRIKKGEDGWGSTGARQIEQWWARWPDANIGLATGDGLIVIDIDGTADAAALAQIQQQQGEQLPAAPIVSTGRGLHLYYAGKLRASVMAPMLVRGGNSYVIAPPSRHYTGTTYQWVSTDRLNEIPKWFRDYLQLSETARDTGPDILSLLGPKPGFLEFDSGVPQENSSKILLHERIARSFETEWTPETEAEIRSALAAIPASCQRLPWLRVGMALHELQWDRSDGTSLAFHLFDEWSSTCAEKYTPHATQVAWNSFRRDAGTRVGLGTLFHMARQQGWRAPKNSDTISGNRIGTGVPINGAVNGVQFALPAELTQPHAIHFADTDDDGRPKATCTNAGLAIAGLGIECRKDTFHDRMTVGGHMIQQWAGELSDDAVQMLRRLIKQTYGFDPNERNTRDAAVQLCLVHPFNPVTDYLDALTWDGTPRIGRWVVDYLSAPDTRLNREIGRLMLVAAVRRARQPGCKFDQIIVWEGIEGTGKSAVLEILAGGRANYSDQTILGRHDREQQEAVQGIWIYEIAELKDMKRADVEHVKAFASRTTDRARPAYGRFRLDAPRKCIFVATTNADTYLISDTGNRRFWPLATGRIDVDAVTRDRDQLWAEAAAQEATGASVVLDWRLWIDAAEAQADRLEQDPWEEVLRPFLAHHNYDVTVAEVLQKGLMLRTAEITQAAQNRVARVLRKIGLAKVRINAGGVREWRYQRVGTLQPR